MKMKLWDRLILRLGAFVTLLTGALAIVGGVLLWDAEVTLLKEWLTGKNAAIVLFAVGALTVLVSLYNLVLPRRYNPNRRAFVTQPTEHGELRIAVSAIENLILRCVEMHKEVKVLAMQIANRRGAVNVNLRVAVNSNISIPHAVEQLQTQVKRYLAASSGIEVRDISVSVERATGDESALPSEPLPKALVESEQPEEKVSVHQRVFGRDTTKSVAEQVAEAEVIEPPVEESAQVEAQEATEEAPAAEEVAEVVEETTEAAAQEEAETVEEVLEVAQEVTEEATEAAKEEIADETEAQA